MSYQVLARKWRPQSFQEMVGQEHVLRALVNALDENRLHHAYLFTGTRGVGKTTVARNFAKALNCEQGISSTPCGVCNACQEITEGRFVDLIEVDAASRTKVEDTRELLDNILYAPTKGRFKIYLIDEVHMLSNHSFNALLKTLEEPPPHIKFLLATTDPQKLPVTILSRCLQFNMKPMPPALISTHLQHILTEEQIPFEDGAIQEIARGADGSMRDALSLLDQAIAYGNAELKTDEVREMLGTVSRDQVLAILRALAAADIDAVMQQVAQLAEMTPDYDTALADLLALLHQLALAQTVPAAVDEHLLGADQLTELATQISAEDVQLYYQIGLIGRRDLPLAPDARSGFEMILLRMLAFKPADAASMPTPAVPKPANRPVNSKSPAKNTTVKAEQPPPSVSPLQRESAKPVVQQTMKNDNANLNKEWHEIVQALNVKGMVRQLALNCELQGYEDKNVVLKVANDYQNMLTENAQQQLQQALSRFFDRDLKLKIVVGSLQHDTLAKVEQKRMQERQAMAQHAIEQDPVIQALKDNFGATVIEESIKPIDS